MVLALLAAAPGTAKATPIAAASILQGTSDTSIKNGGDTIVVTETNASWELIGEKSNGKIIGSPVVITDGVMKFNTNTDKVTFTGSIGGNSFSVKGSLSDYSLSSNNLYYSWDVSFAGAQVKGLNDVLLLDGSPFRLVDAYAGSINIDQNINSPVSGPSDVNFNVSRVSSVPVPPALLLFAPGLFGLIGIRKRFLG